MLTEHDSRPRTDQYEGDSRTPHSTPLDIALAAIANLDINPLCVDPRHAERLLREDMQKIVRALASATAANLKATIAAQNAAIDRLQSRVEIGAKLAAALRPFANCFTDDLANVGGGTAIAPSLAVGMFRSAKEAVGEWEEGRMG